MTKVPKMALAKPTKLRGLKPKLNARYSKWNEFKPNNEKKIKTNCKIIKVDGTMQIDQKI